MENERAEVEATQQAKTPSKSESLLDDLLKPFTVMLESYVTLGVATAKKTVEQANRELVAAAKELAPDPENKAPRKRRTASKKKSS